MIIVSQNKEKIVNFDNVTAIYITKDYSIIAPLISGEMIQLGLYPSLDRAKEILKEILEYYHKLERGKVESIARDWMYFSEKMYFEMPKE
jgi:hypothetical protein